MDGHFPFSAKGGSASGGNPKSPLRGEGAEEIIPHLPPKVETSPLIRGRNIKWMVTFPFGKGASSFVRGISRIEFFLGGDFTFVSGL